MPTIRVHSLFEAVFYVTIASPRPEGTPSHLMPNAKLHDELASRVRAAFKEFRHLRQHSGWVPPEKQIETWLARAGCAGFYAVKTLDPAGGNAEVVEQYFLDVLSMRFDLVFSVMDDALLAPDGMGEAYESNWQRAFKGLLEGPYAMQNVFIPEQEGERPDEKTTIDLRLEMGPAKATMPFNQPTG